MSTQPQVNQEFTCRMALDALMAYLDGELPPGGDAEMQDHLRICRSCRNYLDSYVTTVQFAKSSLARRGAADGSGELASQPEPSDSTGPQELPTGFLDRIRRAIETLG